MAFFDEELCVIVTGAGRGLGRAICLALVSGKYSLKPASTLILMGRSSSKQSLETLKTDLLNVNSSVNVITYDNFDCASLNTEQLRSFLAVYLTMCTSTNTLLLIHNAGTLGDPSLKSLDLGLQYASTYMDINFASMIAANSIILKAFNAWRHKVVVNITSLAAIVSLKSLSLYCSGKAARDMFFQVFALENPTIRVLSYAPGPLDTDMFRDIQANAHDIDTKTSFQETTPIPLEVSIERLFDLLREDKFKSGAHIDFYDALPE